MAMVRLRAMSGVPMAGLPKTNSTVGFKVLPMLCAPAAWSILEKTVMFFSWRTFSRRLAVAAAL